MPKCQATLKNGSETLQCELDAGHPGVLGRGLVHVAKSGPQRIEWRDKDGITDGEGRRLTPSRYAAQYLEQHAFYRVVDMLYGTYIAACFTPEHAQRVVDALNRTNNEPQELLNIRLTEVEHRLEKVTNKLDSVFGQVFGPGRG